MKRHGAIALAALALLAACSSDPDPVDSVDPTPMMLSGPAPVSDTVDDSDVPLALSGLPILDPGWDQAPLELDGLLLGLAHPEGDGPLRFVAAREDGELLWQAERPPSCTGFTLSRADGRPVAVLTDVAPGTETVAEASASAYDLTTGELLWGPRPVPGPYQGPGAVFAAPAPGAAMGDTGPRVALDPATGELLASEEDGPAIVGEYEGVVLTATDDTLTAAGAEVSWQSPLADLGLQSAPVVPAGVEPPAGTVLLVEPGEWAGVLLDLTSGDILAEGVSDAVREPSSDTLVTLEDDHFVGYPDSADRWERPAEGMSLAAAGNVFAYTRSDTAVRALNVVTGADAVAYDDATQTPAVPVLVTSGGATVLQGADLALVATQEP